MAFLLGLDSQGNAIYLNGGVMRPWRLCLILMLLTYALSARAATINLAWDASPGATAYRLYYGLAPGSYHTILETGFATTASVGGLTDGTTYYFAATASNQAGESPFSNEVSAVPREPPPVVIPPPTIMLTTPTDGATVQRNRPVLMAASVQDQGGVVGSVDFYVDGAWQCNDRSVPYTCTWRVPNQRRRTFVLWADIIDLSGRFFISSEPISVETR
jgi:hypothetical protein